MILSPALPYHLEGYKCAGDLGVERRPYDPEEAHGAADEALINFIKMITETKISREEVKTLFVNWGDPEEIRNEKGVMYKLPLETLKLRDKTLDFVDKLYDLQEEITEE